MKKEFKIDFVAEVYVRDFVVEAENEEEARDILNKIDIDDFINNESAYIHDYRITDTDIELTSGTYVLTCDGIHWGVDEESAKEAGSTVEAILDKLPKKALVVVEANDKDDLFDLAVDKLTDTYDWTIDSIDSIEYELQ